MNTPTTASSVQSFAHLDAVLNAKNPYWDVPSGLTPEQQEENYRLYREWCANNDAAVTEAIHALVPDVGTEGTAVYYSDRRAVTVTEVLSPTKVKVGFNKTRCLNYFLSEYEILKDMDDAMGEQVFTKRRNGQWIQQGQPTKGGVYLALHYHVHWIDPNF